VRASSGMPGLFTPMWHQSRWMIDGGVVNPVPVTLCRALGADYVIAVNLNVPVTQRWVGRRVRQEPAPLPPEPEQKGGEASWASMDKWSELMGGLVESLRPSTSTGPGLFEVMAGSIHIMQEHIARSRMAGDPPNLTIAPDLGHFQLMDFHRADEAIGIGYEATKAVLAAMEGAPRDTAPG